MRNLFNNERPFRNVLRFPRVEEDSSVYSSPYISIDMAKSHVGRPPVSIDIKADTGAFRTILTFNTAQRLGIDPIKPKPDGYARSTTDDEIPYYVHQVLVYLGSNRADYREIAFSENVQNNLFGMDWISDYCLVMDRKAVFLCSH